MRQRWECRVALQGVTRGPGDDAPGTEIRRISDRSPFGLRADFRSEIAYPSMRMRAFVGSKGLSSVTTASHSFSWIFTFSFWPGAASAGGT